jgi:peptidoglycan hydrolase CwlO-like protein
MGGNNTSAGDKAAVADRKSSMWRNIVWTALTILTVIVTTTLTAASAMSDIDDNTTQILSVKQSQLDTERLVQSMQTQMAVMHNTVDNMSTTVEELQEQSAEQTSEISELRAEINTFKQTQQQMLEVLLQLNKKFNGSH